MTVDELNGMNGNFKKPHAFSGRLDFLGLLVYGEYRNTDKSGICYMGTFSHMATSRTPHVADT